MYHLVGPKILLVKFSEGSGLSGAIVHGLDL